MSEHEKFKVDIPKLKRRNFTYGISVFFLSVVSLASYIFLSGFEYDWLLLVFSGVSIAFIFFNNLGIRKNIQFSDQCEFIISKKEVIFYSPDIVSSIKFSQLADVKVKQANYRIRKIVLVPKSGSKIIIKDWERMDEMLTMIKERMVRG